MEPNRFDPQCNLTKGFGRHDDLAAMMESRGIVGVNATTMNADIVLDYNGEQSQPLSFDQAVSYVCALSTSDELWAALTKDRLIRPSPK